MPAPTSTQATKVLTFFIIGQLFKEKNMYFAHKISKWPSHLIRTSGEQGSVSEMESLESPE